MNTPGFSLFILLVVYCFCCSTVFAAKKKGFTDPITGMEFVYIPGGCFQMGSLSREEGRRDDEGPVHEVCVDEFYMGKYEVTLGEFKQIIDISNPSFIQRGYYESSFIKYRHRRDQSYFQKEDQYPVQYVSWNDAQDFIKELKNRSGKKYRLPTEAEWEYAARGGTTTVRHWGNGMSCAYAMYDNIANRTGPNGYRQDSCIPIHSYHGLTRNSPAPVGSFEANQFGLYDMLGNVHEWCSDWYGENYYATSPRNNPTGPPTGDLRVLRGGGWEYPQWAIRSACRFGGMPHAHDKRGFRLVFQTRE